MRRSILLLAAALAASAAHGQGPDSDNDGLSDEMENALLQQFAPHFMISAADCSTQPARFKPGIAVPSVAADDGTIYGQATPRAGSQIELHYYHLWRVDCGRMGHALDAEHVAVLLRREANTWQATLWYAAAHEDTVCDDSQIARASTLHAETSGATVWVSAGKHGSFLGEHLCRTGCGADRCIDSRPLTNAAIINLGEWDAPMNGAVWMASPRWPLRDKITRSDFPAARIGLLAKPGKEVAWANPTKRPAQAAIFGASSGIDGTLTGVSATGGALAVSGTSTDAALSTASGKTGNALSTATDKTGKAVGVAAHSTGHALDKTWHGIRKAVHADAKKPAPTE